MKRYRGLVCLLLGTMLLSGCQEAPYELTKEEEALIVSYSTHVVSKFNIYQKDGLTYVADKEEETEVVTEAATEQAEDTTEAVQNTDNASGVTPETATDTEEAGVVATIASVFEETGLKMTYTGYEITDSYMDSSSYAAKPSYGKQFLIISVNVANETEEAIEFNNFGSGITYSAKFKMDSGKRYNAASVMTLASKEFSTYEGTIEAQSAVDMVLIFEIPAEVAEIDELILKINRNEEIFEINL